MSEIQDMDLYHQALRAAAQRIARDRADLARDDAEEIVRTEFAKRGLSIDADAVSEHARWLRRAPGWAVRHPIRARREGVRFGPRWPWSWNETSVPHFVEDLANQEAWQLAGRGVGLGAEALEPAECKRLSRTRYFCAAEVRLEGSVKGRVEISITRRLVGTPRVTQSQIKPL